MSLTLDIELDRNYLFIPVNTVVDKLGAPFRRVRLPWDPKELGYICNAAYPIGLQAYEMFRELFPDGETTQYVQEMVDKYNKIKEEERRNSYVVRHADLFRVKPYKHQEEVIERMMTTPKLALLLEQGLGKTFIVLNALMFFRAEGIPYKALVVCPKIVFPSWVQEIKKYTNFHTEVYLGGPDERRLDREIIENSDWDIVLTTYDMITDTCSSVSKKPCGVNRNVLYSFWTVMSDSDRDFYAEKWVETGALLPSEAEVIKTSEAVPYKLLEKVPQRMFPMAKLSEARHMESNVCFFRTLKFDNLILDEASRVVSPDSKRSMEALALSVGARRTYLLSGTLCVGRPTDFFMPMNILSSNILCMNKFEFMRKYCTFAGYNKHIITGYKNLDQLKRIVQPYIIERTRDECLDLPERTFVKRYYEPTRDMEHVFRELESKKIVQVEGKSINASIPIMKIARALQVLSGFLYLDDDITVCTTCNRLYDCVVYGVRPGSKRCYKVPAKPNTGRSVYKFKKNPKLELLAEDLSDFRDSEKIIIWAWFKQDISEIRNLLIEKGIGFVMAGSGMCVEKFDTNPNVRVFLGQTMQGIGITLNAATCTIYYSHGMMLEARLQSMDRNYRIGQTKPVIVKDYVAQGSIEERIVTLLEHKEDVKDFMQKEIFCPVCSNCIKCMDKHILYLNRGCLYYDERKRAEKRITLSTRYL